MERLFQFHYVIIITWLSLLFHSHIVCMKVWNMRHEQIEGLQEKYELTQRLWQSCHDVVVTTPVSSNQSCNLLLLLQVLTQLVSSLSGRGVPSPVCPRLHTARYLCRVHQIHRRCHFLQSAKPGHPQQHPEEEGQSCCCFCDWETATGSIPPRAWTPTRIAASPSPTVRGSPSAQFSVQPPATEPSYVTLVFFTTALQHDHQQCSSESLTLDHTAVLLHHTVHTCRPTHPSGVL